MTRLELLIWIKHYDISQRDLGYRKESRSLKQVPSERSEAAVIVFVYCQEKLRIADFREGKVLTALQELF